jgi:hypothetical protein
MAVGLQSGGIGKTDMHEIICKVKSWLRIDFELLTGS